MRIQITDAEAMGFLVSQLSHIEAEVYRTQYPDIQYQNLIDVDTSAPEWVKSVTVFSLDRVGQAAWFNHQATDMRLADTVRGKSEAPIEMAGIGYRYSIEELQQAMMLGISITTEKADAARRAAEEMIDDIALRGDAPKGMAGLINHPAPFAGSPPADGSGSSTTWASKTPAQILRDFNALLNGIWTGTAGVEMANTVGLPMGVMSTLVSTIVPNSSLTMLDFISRNNVYTLTTGQPIRIVQIRGLETAGDGATQRAVAYRKDRGVLKLHLPMPHRFMEVFRQAALLYDVPGIFRTGGVEVRRPAAIRYMDGI